MFDIGWSEMAVILLVALVVIGPRDLPRVARTMGKWVAKGRAMAREFQSALEDMAREAELDKVKTEIEKAGRTNIGKSIEKTIDPEGELGQAFDPKAKSKPKAAGKGTPAKDKKAEPAPAAAKEGEVLAENVAATEGAANGAAAGVAEETDSRPAAKKSARETVPADPS